MSDLISRDKLISDIEKINYIDYGSMDSYEAHSAVRNCLFDIRNIVENFPVIDIIPVRCKDCKFYHPNNGLNYMCDRQHFTDTYPSEKAGTMRKPYDYCSYGVKKIMN